MCPALLLEPLRACFQHVILLMSDSGSLSLLGILAGYLCGTQNESLHFSDEHCYTHAT